MPTTIDDLKRVLAESIPKGTETLSCTKAIKTAAPATMCITPREALTAMVEFAKLVLEKKSVRVEFKGPTADDLTRILEELK